MHRQFKFSYVTIQVIAASSEQLLHNEESLQIKVVRTLMVLSGKLYYYK